MGGVSQLSVPDMGTPLRQESIRSPVPVCPAAYLKCCRWKLPEAGIPDVRAKQHHFQWDPQKMGSKSSSHSQRNIHQISLPVVKGADRHLKGVFHDVRQKWKHVHPLFLGPLSPQSKFPLEGFNSACMCGSSFHLSSMAMDSSALLHLT